MNKNGHDLSDTWSPGIEYILEEIRLNSITISEHHKEKYYYSKGYLKYFRIPTILFSAMNSVFSVGLQPYCPQPIISLICCIISLVCGVISSVELFLSIQSTMENELIASKDFYLLSVDIFKILSLERGTRMINGKTYLDEIYQTYCKLIENSNIVNAEMKNMIEPSNHLNLSPKLLSITKEEAGVEIPISKRNNVLKVAKRDDVLLEVVKRDDVLLEVMKRDDVLLEVVKRDDVLLEVAKKEDVKKEEVLVEVAKNDNTYAIALALAIENENIIIQQLEENNNQIQYNDTALEEKGDEKGEDENNSKAKRKYTKKKN